MNKILVLLGLSITLLVSESHARVLSTKDAENLASVGANEEAAETYAKIGELLLMDRSINFADQMFSKALTLSADNVRANFYSAFTQVLLKSQGMKGRVSNLRLDFAVSSEASFARKAWGRPISGAVSRLDSKKWDQFFSEIATPVPNLTTLEGVRKFLRAEVLPILVEGAAKMEKLHGKVDGVTFNVNISALTGRPQETVIYKNCYKDRYGTHCNEYSTTSGDPQDAVFVLNDSILKGLSLAFQYYVTSTQVITSYQVTGLESVLKKMQSVSRNQDGARTFKIFVELVKKYPTLFTLAADSQLKQVVQGSKNILATIFEFDGRDSALCDHRMGQQFELLCNLHKDYNFFRQIEKLLAGQVNALIGYDRRYQPVIVKLNLPGLLNKPVADLKTLLPNDGNIDALPEPTVGGLFPDGDFAKKVKRVAYQVPISIE